MKKWEYKCINYLGNIPEETLATLGDDGWELVVIIPSIEFSYQYCRWIFKREKAEKIIPVEGD